MKRNLVRGIIGGLSSTSALFIFQACYGMPQDLIPDLLIEGRITSERTGQPIRNIRVSVEENGQFVYSDSLGESSFYTGLTEPLMLRFEDTDGSENGAFANRDTIHENLEDRVYVDMTLREQ